MNNLSNKNTMTTLFNNSMREGRTDCDAHLRCDRAESKEESDEQSEFDEPRMWQVENVSNRKDTKEGSGYECVVFDILQQQQ